MGTKDKGASSNPSSAKAWFVTLDRPFAHSPWASWFKEDSFTRADCEKLAEDALDSWFDGGQRKRSEDTNGALAVVERGEPNKKYPMGMVHVHMAICCETSPIKFETLRKRWPHSNIQPVRGSWREVTEYMEKDPNGKHAAKSHLRLSKVHRRGQAQTDNLGTSGGVYDQLDYLIGDCKLKPSQLFAMSTKLSRYANAINSHYMALTDQTTPSFKADLQVHWLCGEPGSGKSYTRVLLMNRYGPENVYAATDPEHKWESYENEPHVIIEDLKPDGVTSLQELLVMTDKYKAHLPNRYVDKYNSYKELYITSVWPPDAFFARMALYCDDSAYENPRQLMRRLTDVIYKWRSFDGSYHSFTLPADEYTDYVDLKRRAYEAPEIMTLVRDEEPEEEPYDAPVLP